MDSFWTLRIKKETAVRFRAFARTNYSTQSLALEGMLDFFKYNEISPRESLGPNARTLESLIKKRFSGLAAIMKDMEKHGVLPTKAMMQLLFEHTPQKNGRQSSIKPSSKEKNIRDDAFFRSAFDAIELQKENTILKQKLEESEKRLTGILDKVQIIKGSFGKSKLVLEMDLKEFQQLKSPAK
ncbi:BfmA/BtgA family mobilization protein [Pricia sp. S334]|uniref:BfmA/BtgA family mobilization protein n=1 Tax=Pricia mediterranea TaxID=3076079 RepID=A0ABU3L3R1_9FLAO|nr:BfmA/BtgA family mobilization protein [Pricia sp. S334]MDT7828386.1 BfmA/BtgA family mobilization protein [Pricia sp. S334]